MKNYRLYQIDAFTNVRFKGNPAGVVPNADGLSDEQMQQIAKELNNSETAFIFKSNSDDYDVGVRFFTPTCEVPSCGHATISAHFVRAMENKLSSGTVIQKIGIGILPVEIEKINNRTNITMTQATPKIDAPVDQVMINRLTDALSISKNNLDERCPIRFVCTGHGKLMIGLKQREILDKLQPDWVKLSDISRTSGYKGFYVFTLDSESPDICAHGRMFAPIIGINEDPVTGNANGPLGAYLVHHRLVPIDHNPVKLLAKQGEAMGRPGIVQITVEHKNGTPTLTKIGGTAVNVFQTEITL